MRKGKNIIAGVVLFLTIAAGYAFYQYNRQPADIRQKTADIQIDAVELAKAFNSDEENSNRKYTDKVLIVTGKLIRVEYDSTGQATMYLDTGDPLASVICSFYKEETPALKNKAPGTTVHVKGVCVGKLMDVVLNKCSMTE